MNKAVFVTQPSLAPLEEYAKLLEEAWASGILTHNGPLMRRLEKELAAYLGCPDLVCLANGTCAMQLSIRALDLTGEIITTPFTFIATANIISWERCRPVFVDIEPDSWNMDPHRIEAAITPRTSAILPVHVFSAPCSIDLIEAIAKHNALKVIYDAAHALAVNYHGKSVLNYGDISCVSFHATKLFNTAEGGGCVSQDPGLNARVRRLRFFGFDESKEVVDEGMNAKMTEVHAALGLANLRYLDQVRANRRRKYSQYMEQLEPAGFVSFQRFNSEEYNYSYMPVLLDSEARLVRVLSNLAAKQITPRRYFSPSLNMLKHFAPNCSLPVSESVAARVLCLPLYDSLAEDEIARVCQCVRNA